MDKKPSERQKKCKNSFPYMGKEMNKTYCRKLMQERRDADEDDMSVCVSNEQYEKAYDKLSGIKLNGSDKTLYKQASTIMYVQKQYDSYENYMKLNMKTEALDSLIKGVNRYNSLRPQAQELGIDNKFTAVYKQIVLALQDTFKISETEAIGLSSMSDTDFTNYYYRIEEYGKAVQ